MSAISSSHAVTQMMAPAVMAQEGLDRAARPRQGTEAGKQTDKSRGDLLSFSTAASSVIAGAAESDPLTPQAVQAPNPEANVSNDPADKGFIPQERTEASERPMIKDNSNKGTGPHISEQEGSAPLDKIAPGFPSSPAEAAAANIGRTYEERSADAEAAPGGDIPQPKPLPAPEAAANKITATRAERREVDKFSPSAPFFSGDRQASVRAPAPAGSVIDLQS